MSLTPEDKEFEQLFIEKQKKVEALEKQLAKLTEMLAATVEVDPETEAKNQDSLEGEVEPNRAKKH